MFQLWCAAGVNLSGGRAAHASELIKQAGGSQSSLDQLEQENKVRRSALWLGSCTLCYDFYLYVQERGDQDKELVLQDEMSSRVWVCISSNSSTKVMVLDATQPADLLDSFYACNTHVGCIASVPGRPGPDMTASFIFIGTVDL